MLAGFQKFKLPAKFIELPIPTPPVTIKAPVRVVPEPVLSVMETAFVKVLIPANDCASVETKPVDAIPANGIFNV